jgi:hypothetical protein
MAGGHPGGGDGGGTTLKAKCVVANNRALAFNADPEDVAYFKQGVTYVIRATQLPDDSGTGEPLVGDSPDKG